jgi:hypothetical protein
MDGSEQISSKSKGIPLSAEIKYWNAGEQVLL